eukprot:CAMPEP_0185790900 /NCGR_PEP_ID=MMETSP1174-20130828/158068_1 /TAXON_ID=35687 /ORGANISM="Dictyocha speculum, Strain CCMP1381" /LENGTH=226 /DNA_ID=CAMNT_0028485771 /DNA_START=165 /DNA_END=844 /DNA_ORIENTATION=+
MATNRVCNSKLVLLGDTAVGKSCLAVRFVHDEFYQDRGPTVGAAFLTREVVLEDATVKFEIWDTAGQERYRSLASLYYRGASAAIVVLKYGILLDKKDIVVSLPLYYRGASAAIVVYDITNKDSFVGAKIWVNELQRRSDETVVIVLAGNKMDLEHKRKVEFEEASDYAQENNIMHMETSARSATNVEAVFEMIARKIPMPKSQLDHEQRDTFSVIPPVAARTKCC